MSKLCEKLRVDDVTTPRQFDYVTPSKIGDVITNGSRSKATVSVLTDAEKERAITCKRCEGDEVKVVYLPCAHLVVCAPCAERETDCLVCGENILKKMEIFL